jgi:predicted CopG family antitoxin
MATKTITLELDAYDKLRAAKLPGESFSAVVRRAAFLNSRKTAGELIDYLSTGGSDASDAYLDSLEAAIKHDPAPRSPWD